jgi:hypothetical protein
MAVLEQAPWAGELIARGRLEQARKVFLRTLRFRFGELPPEGAARLRDLPADDREALADAAFTNASLAAFLARLPG